MIIILFILITLSLDSVWILLGENCCWSLLGLKGLNGIGISLAPLMLTVHSPLFFGEMAETEHLPLWAAIVVSNVPSLARPYEYQIY